MIFEIPFLGFSLESSQKDDPNEEQKSMLIWRIHVNRNNFSYRAIQSRTSLNRDTENLTQVVISYEIYETR